MTNCRFCSSSNCIRYGHRHGKRNVQLYLCKNCNRKFSPDNGFIKMRNSPKIITATLDLYFKGLSFRKISDHLQQFYKVEISHVTILNWIRKYTTVIKDYTDNLKYDVSPNWHLDECMFSVNGKFMWFFDAIDEDTRFLLAAKVAESRTMEDTRDVMKECKKKSLIRPKQITTDGMMAYEKAIKKTFPTQVKRLIPPIRHERLVHFYDKINQNLIERYQGTMRDRFRPMRGFKNIQSAQQLLDGFLLYYNFIKPHAGLNGKTPAEATNINFRLQTNKWLDLIKISSKGVHGEN